MTPAWFVEQMRWLSEGGFAALTIDELASLVLPLFRHFGIPFDIKLARADVRTAGDECAQRRSDGVDPGGNTRG